MLSLRQTLLGGEITFSLLHAVRILLLVPLAAAHTINMFLLVTLNAVVARSRNGGARRPTPSHSSRSGETQAQETHIAKTKIGGDRRYTPEFFVYWQNFSSLFWTAKSSHTSCIFFGPRCLWGPIYGFECLKLTHLCADLTDVTLADEDINSILTDNANRAFQGNVAM